MNGRTAMDMPWFWDDEDYQNLQDNDRYLLEVLEEEERNTETKGETMRHDSNCTEKHS